MTSVIGTIRRRKRSAGVGVALVAAWIEWSCAAHSRPTTVILDAGATIPPQVVRQGKIELPTDLSARSCKSGRAVVEVEVGATGLVQRTRVVRASSEPAFDEACARSAQSSEYRPATAHGASTIGVTKIECRLECP